MPREHRRQFMKAAALGGATALAGCLGGGGDDSDGNSLYFVYMNNMEADIEDIVPIFEEETDIDVSRESSPGQSSDTREYYINQFTARAGDFDIGSMDVIWPGEFAGNGWAAEINDPEGHTDNMLETPVEAVTVDGAMYGMPMFTDANALYYRTDKLDEYGYDGPPETYMELVGMAQDIMEQDDEINNGYVWQGGTNEGLTIMWLNWVWGMNGEIWDGESITVNTEEGVTALQHAVDLIHEYEITPGSIPSSETDGNRETFQQGNTVFMRNWPYAVARMNEEGSAVQGRFDVAPLPTHEDYPDANNSCLGGWNVFINAFTENTENAQAFANFVASSEIQERLALEHSRLPVRQEIYENDEIREEFPELEMFEGILDRTRVRPPIVDYPTFSQIVFTEANTALVQQKTPQEALDDAQEQIDNEVEV